MIRRGVLSIIILLLLWQIVVLTCHVPSYFLPTPWAIAQTLWASKALLWQAMWGTVAEALLGWVSAFICGCLLALVIVGFRPAKHWLLPIVLMSQALPTFALAPLFVVWLGYGIVSKVAVALFVLFFPITVAFYDGLKRTPILWQEQAQIMGASRWRMLRYIAIPAALPNLASGLRMAAVWAPMAAVIGEWVGASHGLGFLMIEANARIDMTGLSAAIFVLVVITGILYSAIDFLLRRLIFW